jgi:hypothetical protein
LGLEGGGMRCRLCDASGLRDMAALDLEKIQMLETWAAVVSQHAA